MSTLEPCPLCGEVPKRTDDLDSEEYIAGHCLGVAGCTNDLCQVPSDLIIAPTQKEATTIWNTRPREYILRVRIAKLEAEVEDLKPYKYGYSSRKKPKFNEWVIVDYEGFLDFGRFDDDGNWETCGRDNIRKGIRRWYPLPISSDNIPIDAIVYQ